MKILQINKLYHPVIGGIETIVKNIADELNKDDDFTVDVLACQEKGRRQIEVIDNTKVFKAASYGKKLGMPLSFDFFRLFFKIRHHYDLIIIHYPFPLAALLFPFLPKNKYIIYYHSDIIRQKYAVWFFSYCIKKSLDRAKSILVASNNLINSSPALKKRQTKCQVIPFGLKIDYSQTDREEALALRQKYSPQKPLILSVGRLVYYKGYKYAISAISGLNAKLLIIGAGPEKEKLRSLIKDLKLEENIEIISPQENIKPFFLACDLFLFPSIARSEAFGLVQLEAMAASKPIVNTILKTGVEEVSIDGVSGISVEPRNTKAIRNAIEKIIYHEDLRQEYSVNARKRYEILYTLEVFIEKIKNTLIDLK
jgi:glycosyltransferase involved in cell wall biosynthesis